MNHLVQGLLPVTALRVLSIDTMSINLHSEQDVLSFRRQHLRQELILKRQSLSEQAQEQAAHCVCRQALSLLSEHTYQSVAFYLPFRGEISPLPLIHCLQQQGVNCLLPVLHPFSPNYLQFSRYQSVRDLKLNRFGILEPKLDVRHIVPLDEIDVIFVPLVGCDKQNNRLGMGGGFYDRTLALMPHCRTVGLAHRCQQIGQLPSAAWDIPLDHILLG